MSFHPLPTSNPFPLVVYLLALRNIFARSSVFLVRLAGGNSNAPTNPYVWNLASLEEFVYCPGRQVHQICIFFYPKPRTPCNAVHPCLPPLTLKYSRAAKNCQQKSTHFLFFLVSLARRGYIGPRG